MSHLDKSCFLTESEKASRARTALGSFTFINCPGMAVVKKAVAVEFCEANIRVGQIVNTLFCLVVALFGVKIHIFFSLWLGFTRVVRGYCATRFKLGKVISNCLLIMEFRRLRQITDRTTAKAGFYFSPAAGNRTSRVISIYGFTNVTHS